MKTHLLLKLMVVSSLAATSAFAQNAPEGTISSPPGSSTAAGSASASTSASGSGISSAPDFTGQSYSLDEISSQIRQLQREVEQTLPMLTSLTQTGTNAPAIASTNQQTSTAGTIAGVIGSILNRNTNDVTASTPSAGTNVLENILRGVMGTTNGTATASSATAGDLIILRQQLQNIEPILERLSARSLSTEDLGIQAQQPPNGGLTPTSRR